MQPILITGASGLVGGALMDRFRPDGPVVGTARRHAGADLRAVDLRQRDEVVRLLDVVQPHAVVHAAACPDPDLCESDPAEARRLNVDSVRWLIEYLPPGVPLVFVSTDYVFDGDHAPYVETDPVRAVNVYGQTKVEAESIVRTRSDALIIRIPLQVGPVPASGKPGFIAQLRAQIEAGTEAEVDDVLIRVPTWSGDVADAIAFLLQKRAAGIFHVSSPEAGTRWAWTLRLARQLGRPIPYLRPSTCIIPRKARRPVDGHLLTGKLAALGWSRYTPFETMVERLSQA